MPRMPNSFVYLYEVQILSIYPTFSRKITIKSICIYISNRPSTTIQLIWNNALFCWLRGIQFLSQFIQHLSSPVGVLGVFLFPPEQVITLLEIIHCPFFNTVLQSS